jgi:hypothetical protein
LLRVRDALSICRKLAPIVASSVPMYAPLVTLLVIAYEDISLSPLPLFVVPARR